MENMTQAEYARHRGVSRAAISKLVKSGRIPPSAFDEAGKINPAAADFALGETRQRVSVLADDDEQDAGAGGADPTFGSNAAAAPASNNAIAALTRTKVASEYYRAELLKLEHRQKVGQLLPIEQVTEAMQRCAGVIVREIDQLPTYADELAAVAKADGVAGVRVALKNLARAIRLTLEQNMRLAADETARPPAAEANA